MVRSACISAVAFLVLANPSFAQDARPVSRPVAALIGEPSADPSAQPLVVELESKARPASEVSAPSAPLMVPSLWLPGPYGAWDLDAPGRRGAARFSISGAFPEGSGARFDATPIRVRPHLLTLDSGKAVSMSALRDSAPLERAAA